MEKLLQAAAIAWNPIGEVRRRMESGILNVGSVLVPYIGIIIACNLFGLGAQRFFFESVFYSAGAQLPHHPLVTSDYAQRTMSALGVLAPIAAVSLLPTRIFHPPGRSATISAMLVVAAAWAFYGAVISGSIHFIAGSLATVDLELGISTFSLLTIPASIVILGLTLFFWLRITLNIFGLSGFQMIGISIVAIIPLALLAWFVAFVSMSSL